MVYKEILLIAGISLVLFSVGLIKNVNACSLLCNWFYKDPGCTQSTYACEWTYDAGGCQIGFPAGQLYTYIPLGFVRGCSEPEAKWLTSGGKDGGVCKIKWNPWCSESEGKWDESEKKCIYLCAADHTESTAYRCSGTEMKFVADGTKCESACGAGDGFNDTLIDENPINNCIVAGITVPAPENKILKGESFTIKVKFSGTDSPYENVAIKRRDQTSADRCVNYQQLVCTYGTEDIGLKAPSTPGSYTYDVYCSGSSSSTCAVSGGVKQTFTIEVVSCLDRDNTVTGNLNCPVVSGIRQTCVNYVCQPRECNPANGNADCNDPTQPTKYRCCEAVVGGKGECRNKGYIYNSKYLCDPGEWVKCDSNNVNSIRTFDGENYKCISENGEYKWVAYSESKQTMTIFDLIINFFKVLFGLDQ